MKLTPQIEILGRAAACLGTLSDRFVFVGGSVVDLLLSDPQAPFARPTDDIDLIVELSTIAEYYDLAEQMRRAGFREDVGSPVICRWLAKNLVVDLMPSREGILGFSNRWYVSAIPHRQRTVLPNGIEISIIDAPHFIATKLEAFASRGKGDMFQSHDLEDIVAVFSGRSELPMEIAGAPEEVKNFICRSVFGLTNRPGVHDAVEGHLASLLDSKSRSTIVLERLREVASQCS